MGRSDRFEEQRRGGGQGQRRGVRWRMAGVLGAAWASVGCGLRTEPSEFDRLTEPTSTTTSQGPARTCEDPSILPTVSASVSGVFRRGGAPSGWCGDDEGPDAVYVFRPVEPTDVSLRLRELDDSAASNVSFRVMRGDCGEDDTTLRCDTSEDLDDDDDAVRTFYAEPGSDYFIIIDTPDADALETPYAFDFDLEPPSIDACPIHRERVTLTEGKVFRWNNDLSPGQGKVDGPCGAPGRENMFRLDIQSEGWLAANVDALDGLVPHLSLRTGCGGTTELTCDAGRRNQFASIEAFIQDPGVYYLVIDGDLDGGAYDLEIRF